MATAFSPETNDELWRKCAFWLTKWEMIRHDHKVNLPNSKIVDLAGILRDGVLLCRLLNKIDPGCIDMKDVSLKPTMAQFLCLRNINLFLKTCKESFGVTDLFDATMLFDLSNFHKVLCTLSKLSLSSKALRGDIPGFYAQRLNTDEEEIYHSLKTDQPTAHRSLDIIDSDCGLTQEEIYQDLLVVRSSIEQPQLLEKRDFVIKELLDTESNYVDVLNKLKVNFMIPLLNQMRPEDHSAVFHKIKELHEIHSAFLLEITRTKRNRNVKLAQVFLQFREKFLIYGSYCANLTKATTVLQELCDQDEMYNQAVIRYEKEVNNGRFKLRDVLSVPMQRILKYHLLLEKLIENTDVNHDEYADLRKAREAMLDVAGYINEAARDVEHLNVINNLQDTIVEWDHDPNLKLSDYGKLIKDAELRIKAHDDQKTRNRYVFIFDKCILICKQLRGNQFAFRGILNIIDYDVEDIHNRAVLNREGRWSYSFLLVKKGAQMAYTINVRSLEIKTQIMKALHDALDNVQPRALTETTHRFQVHTFPTPVQCGYCYKYLKGLIFQGYLCSICRYSVHKDCIQYSGKCGAPRIRNGLSNGINENDPLRDKMWYVGEMTRETAEKKLKLRENGSFLVRIRPNSDSSAYALTLKTGDKVRHMKICESCEEDSNKYFFSRSRLFNSIEELIFHYESHSLKENFENLGDDAVLLFPFYQLKAVVLRDHIAQDRHQLSIQEGQIIHVIGKDGYREGWWKGRTANNEIGYFPISLIRLDGEIKFD